MLDVIIGVLVFHFSNNQLFDKYSQGNFNSSVISSKWISQMLNKLITALCFIFISSSIPMAGENADLDHLTSECIKAAKEHKKIKKDFPYKVLHTVHYNGWSGNSKTFKLIHSVSMVIRYAGSKKKGYYWFTSSPDVKYHVTAKSDLARNYEMVEVTGDGHVNHSFTGRMKNGIIKGIWTKGDDKKAFAFYVEAVKEK